MFVIDCSLHTTKHIACLKEAGVDVVFRYYARRKQPGYEEKILRSDEAIALSETGISIAVVYQYNARSPGKFNYDQGLSDGRVARKYAHKTIKQPAGTAIYFGVDYDPLHEHISTHIMPHFKGLAEAMREDAPYAPYHIGVYGGWNVCDRLDTERLVKFKWLSQSTGYGGSAERKRYVASKRWDLVQGMPRKDLCHGLEHDRNIVKEGLLDFGQFTVPV
jgi:hypothetical protein